MTLQNFIDYPNLCTSNFIIYRAPDGEYYPLSKDIVVDIGNRQICIYNGVDLKKSDFLQVSDLMQYLETEEFKDFAIVMGSTVTSVLARSPVKIKELHDDRVVMSYDITVTIRDYK